MRLWSGGTRALGIGRHVSTNHWKRLSALAKRSYTSREARLEAIDVR